jgi:hypothetical protein
MRKTIGEMQDRILAGYDKENKRNGQTAKKLPTLAEQIKELEDWKALSSTEKYKRMEWRDWEDLLYKFLDDKRACTPRQFLILISSPKTKSQFVKFKEEGTDFLTIKEWISVNNPDRY